MLERSLLIVFALLFAEGCREGALMPICAYYSDDGLCVPECPTVTAPVLTVIDDDEVLRFEPPPEMNLEVAIISAASAIADAPFERVKQATEVRLSGQSGPTRVLARVSGDGCAASLFNAVYDVRETYAPTPPAMETTAVAHDDPRIERWANGVVSYLPGTGVSAPRWMNPENGLGPAGTDPTKVVVLGNAGELTLRIEPPIGNREGWDFAVFENGFAGDAFIELAFVEVSSDGVNFLRFDSAFRGDARASQVGGLAGTFPIGYGTPFDLDALKNAPSARAGEVDLMSISHVRLIDILGDGATLDSFGRAIVDSVDRGPSAGFDLNGVAVRRSK